jgi:hypothetical protein
MSNPNRRYSAAYVPVRLRPNDAKPGEFNKRAERHGNAQDARRRTSTYDALATYRRGQPDDAVQLAQEQAAYRAKFGQKKPPARIIDTAGNYPDTFYTRP